jgi:hypothetical protein
MTWAEEEQRRWRAVYEAAVSAWYRAKSEGHLVQETDGYQRSAGAKWRAVDPEGKAALSAFQLAKSNLDHISERVRREAGDTKCPTCPEKDALARVSDYISGLAEPDRRLPPERDSP